MQATVKYPRLAAVIAAIEKTGRTKAQIGRLAGRDGSAATRWAKGTHLPGWSAARSLADAVRGDSPALADELLAAWHYYSDPVEQGSGSTVPADVLAVIRKRYTPDQQREIIEMLGGLSEPPSETGPSEDSGPASERAQRAG